MKEIEILHLIGFDADSVSVIVKRNKLIKQEFFDYDSFCTDTQKHIKSIEKYCKKNKLNIYEIMLGVYCQLSLVVYDRYKAEGISNKIFSDTFKDLLIWSQVCLKLYGILGLKEYVWLQHHIKLNLFRLGRLQFLPQNCSKKYILPNGTTILANDTVLTVHIPDDGRLGYDECQKSYNTAIKFFNKRGINTKVFMCESWLLNNNLKSLLAPETNIIKFQNDYKVFDGDENSRQAEERIFEFDIKSDPKLYPQSTSLQKKLRQYLIDGGKMGTKIGLFAR